MVSRRFASFGVVSLCLLACCVFCASAQALMVHRFQLSFGSPGSGSGQFNQPGGVAVNDVTHDVYVVDEKNNRVEEFNSTGSTVIGEFNGAAAPTGAFSGPTQIVIDNSKNPLDPSKEDVYVEDRGHGVIDKFDVSGVYQGQIVGTPAGAFEPEITKPNGPRVLRGVAVDQSGAVWIATTEDVYTFSDASVNQLVSERGLGMGLSLDRDGLAVDSQDNFYGSTGFNRVTKFSSTGEVLNSPVGPPFEQHIVVFASAVDPIGNEIYLDNWSESSTSATIDAVTLNGELIENFGEGHISAPFPPISRGVAVDASNGTVYVTDGANNVSIFEAIFLPTVTIEPVSEQQPRSFTLNGTVNPEGRPVTSCVFEYGTTPMYGQSVPCTPDASALGSGSSPVPVSAHLMGLTPGSTYYYRLVAENTGGKNPTHGQEVIAGPVLGGESAVDVTSSSATLQDTIDPNGADTHYYVEYGPTTAYGSYAPVLQPGMDLGSAVGTQPVSVHIQGLEAGTLYHYRFVAVQAGELFPEPDSTITTQSIAAQTTVDGRAWELVSPANKKGAFIGLFETGGQIQAANDGSAITYVNLGSSLTAGAIGHVTLSQELSKREASGWRTEDLTLPSRLPENEEPAEVLAGLHFEYKLFSPDLSLAAVEPQDVGTPPLAPEVTERTLYLRNDVNADYSPLVTAANAKTPIEEPNFNGVDDSEWEMTFLAASPDLRHVLFKTPKALTADAIDEETVQKNISGEVQWNIYEWSEGDLQLVNVLPKKEGVAHGPYPNIPPVRLAGMSDSAGGGRGNAQRSMSNDGRWIAWTWGNPYQEPKYYRGLYVRDMVEESTVRVGGPKAIYQTMNGDGSKVFYLENGELYMFLTATGEQVDLTAGHGVAESSAGVQQAVSDVSEDGSYVYFVATGVLASGAVSGANNLYLLHDTGEGWVTTRIATLSNEDKPSWYGAADGAPALQHVSSRASPDGRYLAFMSNRSLTGYDNIDAMSGEPDEEVYLYDAATGKLVCGSCNPTGARPRGVFDSHESELLVDRSEVWTEDESNAQTDPRTNHWLAGNVPGWEYHNGEPPTYQPRYLSNSGRIFFDSPDSLVPQDTNGLEDVYEYEPMGIGSCTAGGLGFSERSDGCVNLISSGTSGSESAFFDASESGDDVFFTTRSKLVGEDYDDAYDVYDAHVCTSSVPCKVAPVSPPPCTSGDSCKAPPSSQPELFGPAPSETFEGAGNVIVAVGPAARPTSLTDAQKLSRALRGCHTQKGMRRKTCERRARQRYPVKRTGRAGAKAKGRKG